MTMNTHPANSALDKLSFEEALKQLEEIVQKMNDGQVPLEDAVQLYEKGMALQAVCSKKLEDAKMRIEKISVDENGQIHEEPMAIPKSLVP